MRTLLPTLTLTLPLLLLAPAMPHAAQPIPQTGKAVDETHAVTQRAAMPAPCAAIATRNATLYLSMQRLADIADAIPERVQSADDVTARLWGERAAALLEKLDGPVDADGCRTPRTAPSGQEQYLILDEVRKGEVYARAGRSGEHVPVLHIRYLAKECGFGCSSGTMHLRLPDHEGTELDLSWWQS